MGLSYRGLALNITYSLSSKGRKVSIFPNEWVISSTAQLFIDEESVFTKSSCINQVLLCSPSLLVFTKSSCINQGLLCSPSLLVFTKASCVHQGLQVCSVWIHLVLWFYYLIVILKNQKEKTFHRSSKLEEADHLHLGWRIVCWWRLVDKEFQCVSCLGLYQAGLRFDLVLRVGGFGSFHTHWQISN